MDVEVTLHFFKRVNLIEIMSIKKENVLKINEH